MSATMAINGNINHGPVHRSGTEINQKFWMRQSISYKIYRRFLTRCSVFLGLSIAQLSHGDEEQLPSLDYSTWTQRANQHLQTQMQ